MNSINEISKRWGEEGKVYVAHRNEYFKTGMSIGWDKVEKPPEDTRSDLAEIVLEHVRKANEIGNIESVRQKFPPAHAPFQKMLNKNGQHLGPVALLDNDKILIRVGSPYGEGRVYLIDDLEIQLIENVLSFGWSPNKRYLAVARRAGVEVLDRWGGKKVAECHWPTGNEGAPPGYEIKSIEGIPHVTQIIPFPDGKRVLLVSSKGIFVLAATQAVRLHPSIEHLKEHFDWLKKEYPKDELDVNIDMEHGAISPDGNFIAVGSQDYFQHVYNSDYEQFAEIGHLSEYPHYALFSGDGEMLALNSCYFYNGATIGVPVSLLPELFTAPYELDSHLVVLEKYSKVYAATYRQDEFIIGDAYGYIRAFDKKGNYRWNHFLGSSIGDIDISKDGKTLLVCSYAGFLSIIKLDTGEVNPFTIGDATHEETRRWLFWRKEKKPLVW